jgi:hypothetical protein
MNELDSWATDGHRVWRAPGGPTVCVLGDPTQGQLFDDAEHIAHQLRNAALIVCAPRLQAALLECAARLERCCHHSGSGAEFAHLAVRQYRQLVAESKGQKPTREGT